ncbi:MAG: corrinoid protein [Thermoanaerobacteraceae bacterium]|nr:corrinoid protein [Thermoanaerobacteraceae bacterium]
MSVLEEIKNGVITYQPAKVKELCEKALAEGIEATTIVSDGLIAGMSVVGEKFKRNEVFVPEVLIAAKATHAGMDVLKPVLSASKVEPVGTVVIGTVKEDLHDIGKNLVAMMLEGAGFKVYNIGINVPPEKFVQAIEEYNPDIVCLSSLITSTLHWLGDTIKVIKESCPGRPVKIMVGGAPVTQELADEIGADGYGKDAQEAVEKARSLIGIN